MNAVVRAPIHPNPALYISPEMITELALGVEPPLDVAARYAISAAEFCVLQGYSWFAEMVVKRRMELDAEGILFEHQAGMMAQELYVKSYQAGMAGQLAGPLMLQLAKDLREIAKPKQAAAMQGGGGPQFQINIQVNGAPGGPVTRAGAIEAQVVEASKPVISIPLEPQLPPAPAGFRVPDFDTRPSALVGTPAAIAAAQEPR